MSVMYFATREEAYGSLKPILRLVRIDYVDRPLYLMHDAYNREIEPPDYVVASRTVTLPPYTRSHSIMVAAASPEDMDVRLSIISADEDRTTVTRAMEAEVNTMKKEAERQLTLATTDDQMQAWTIESGWNNFDNNGVYHPHKQAWYYRPHTKKWIWWELWVRKFSNDGAVRDEWVDMIGEQMAEEEQIARQELEAVRTAGSLQQKIETEAKRQAEVKREAPENEGALVAERYPKSAMKPVTERAVKREEDTTVKIEGRGDEE
jgi:hypothetical protein